MTDIYSAPLVLYKILGTQRWIRTRIWSRWVSSAARHKTSENHGPCLPHVEEIFTDSQHLEKKCGFSMIILMSILVFMGIMSLHVIAIVVEHIPSENNPLKGMHLNPNSTLSFWNFNFWNPIESLLLQNFHLPKIILK